MLRRVLFIVSLSALGMAGAASATFAGDRAAPATTTAGTATIPATTTTTTTAAAQPVVSPAATVVISGHGWGHGLGMAQWGAYGYALHGWGYDRILAHYYQGTTLEKHAGVTVRVLLREGAASATISSTAPFSATDAKGVKVALPAGETTVDTTLALTKKKKPKLAQPLTFTAGKEPIAFDGKPYRGTLVVLSNGQTLQVVNTLKLDAYVKGVVGNEMPYTWPAGALQAQAVAARTYALASLTTVVTARPYDLYPDSRSQVYGGIEAETPSVVAAVDATARRVIVSGGKPITAYYSSSSGGQTASAVDTLGRPVPYLVSVEDPYDTLSPNHDWGPVVFDAKKLAKTLKVSGGLLDLRAATGASGRVTSVTAVASGGDTAIQGPTLRTLLGLRSTFFSVGWLSLDPAPNAAYGIGTTLTGIARDAGPVSIEAKTAGGAWRPVAAVTSDVSGAFRVVVKPEATTQYRLAAGAVHASLVSVPVEPVIDASVSAGAVSGSVQPPLPGVSVQLQRLSGASWATVATAKPDTFGAYAVAAAVQPGSYRVRFAPGRGLVPGVSPTMAVR